ncbi:hypothetical protein [Paenarthrobacter nitroguajacolicus]|uniref:hypothetical protein n=1 Tax=Paenarthrobacter nitroguajacolicus TaxID=211146 RepID=UPI00248B5B96|nr:hypothetical protein [Paenarthrobacter nitroguajacolicus]MDI2033097.1 hypothetical protein [Paenarthrobacter nitroguajacolicus]
MINTRRGMIVAALKSYGEESTAEWARSAPGDALQTTLTVASWILNFGPTQPSGASILIDKAIALAGVCIHEEHPRDLAQKRSDLKVWREIAAEDSHTANEVLQGLSSYDVVSDEIRDFWAEKSS